ncbi:hypothetical protein D5F01_LYC13220 [Larimichthys crocea]|uniref:Uncharacterized protein n=1 Tax=Larimichthys crocea TaxID=215358 RepID=A0A6G0IDE7_LARCR|nr:hypothetical protein D5F01_LYC13220 [Larimichthys crocea]
MPPRAVCPRTAGIQCANFGQIAENSPAGTPVDGVVLPLGCPGADLNGSLRGDYASDFKLVHYRGHREHRGHLGLVSAKALDREFIAMYELTVELPPRCLRRPAAVQVDELTPLGTELVRFDAKDGDAERNGRVTFYASPESDLLHVVPQTGQVRLVGSLLGVSQVTLRLHSSARSPRSVRGADLHRDRAGPKQSRGPGVHGAGPEVRAAVVRSDVRDGPAGSDRAGLGASVLARSLREPAEVAVKIQNLRARLKHLEPSHLEESPRHLEESPRHLEESSRHLVESPRHLEESPRHLEETPRHLEESPRHLVESPRHLKGVAPSPGGDAPSPGGVAPSPGGVAPSPGGVSPSPGGDASSPGGVTPSTGGVSPSPGGDALSPERSHPVTWRSRPVTWRSRPVTNKRS